MPEEEIVEAMVVLRNEDGDPADPSRVGEPVAELEPLRDLGNPSLEHHTVGVKLGDVEADTLEELARVLIGMLVGVEDIRSMAIKELSQRCDDPAAVLTGNEERRLVGGAGGHCRKGSSPAVPGRAGRGAAPASPFSRRPEGMRSNAVTAIREEC